MRADGRTHGEQVPGVAPEGAGVNAVAAGVTARAAVGPLSGWGNHPVQTCRLLRPEQRRELIAAIRGHGPGTCIARGSGRSYGDEALNQDGTVVLTTRLNRFIAFDPQRALLDCEAGVTLAEVIEHLVPRGFFLPVTPGTKWVTIGGAIANDVHGKNHHADGSIARFVVDFELLTADGGVLTCSRSENPDVFWASVGGLGLTGVILRGRLQLRRIETSRIAVTSRRGRNLDEALALLDEADAAHRYSVAWIDCLSAGRSLGRSVVVGGDHATPADLGERGGRGGESALQVTRRARQRTIPFFLPSWVLGTPAATAFNALYYHSHRPRSTVVDYDSFFYPLDAVGHWNRLYGRRGFIQCQVALPHESSREGLVALLAELSRARRPSFLGVLKRFGPPSGGLLSFPIEGHTLALDMPVAPDIGEVMRRVHAVVLRHGGRAYLAKDATLSAAAFRQMYPRHAEFLAVKRRLDPEGTFSSSLARRLGIVAGEA